MPEMVPLIENNVHQYAEQATVEQRVLLAKMCRENGVDPKRLPIRTKADASLILNCWMGNGGPLKGYGFTDSQGTVEIKPRA